MASTYNRILEHVSQPVRQHADIHLNEPVIKIDAKPRLPGNERHAITLTTTRKSYSFDEVVVSCPLGWLKRNKSSFSPELPLRLEKAIDSISYGRLEKVYVTFPHAFWHSTMTMTTTLDTPPSSPFSQFLEPSYVKTRPANTTEWNQECVSLASLSAPYAHPTLLFYIYGPCATYIVTQLRDQPTTSSEFEFLDEFTRPFYSRLRGFSASNPECKPLAFLATQWQNDPHAGNGSYCNFQVGVEEADLDIEILRAGMGEERGVWFAGEHTAPFVALGTTTGAYWSGERAAGQICDVYGLGRKGINLVKDDSLPSMGGKKVHVESRVPAIID